MSFGESFTILAEILLCFLAVVGIAYLINDIIELLRCKNASSRLPLIVDCSSFNAEEAEKLARDYSRLVALREFRHLVGKLIFVIPDDSLVTLASAERFVRMYPGTEFLIGEKADAVHLSISSENIIN